MTSTLSFTTVVKSKVPPQDEPVPHRDLPGRPRQGRFQHRPLDPLHTRRDLIDHHNRHVLQRSHLVHRRRQVARDSPLPVRGPLEPVLPRCLERAAAAAACLGVDITGEGGGERGSRKCGSEGRGDVVNDHQRGVLGWESGGWVQE